MLTAMIQRAAEEIVVRALVGSYPSWTDEHGTNVEQLARIAVRALRDEGLLGPPLHAPQRGSLTPIGT
jgi:hypothetical protein